MGKSIFGNMFRRVRISRVQDSEILGPPVATLADPLQPDKLIVVGFEALKPSLELPERGVVEYLSLAVTLREADRFEEAEALLAEALERFPDDLGIAIESARSQTHRQNWAEALRRWKLVRTRFPDQSAGYLGAAVIYRELLWFNEAEPLLAKAIECFPAEAEPLVECARIAEARGDWSEAARRWETARHRFPDQVVPYEAGAAALRELGRLDQAQAVEADAAKRFRPSAPLAIDQSADLDVEPLENEAAQPMQVPAQRTQAGSEPTAPEPSQGALHMPQTVTEDAAPAIDCAPQPDVRSDWVVAMQRWEAAYAGFLDHVPQYSTGINAGQQTCSFRDAADGLNAAAGGTLEIALVDKEKLEAPLAALRRALTQRPEDPKAHDDLGVALMIQGRTGESIARYERAIALRPDYADAHLNYSTALMLQGRIDEAIARYQRAVALKLDHFDALCRSSAPSGCGIEVVLAA